MGTDPGGFTVNFSGFPVIAIRTGQQASGAQDALVCIRTADVNLHTI